MTRRGRFWSIIGIALLIAAAVSVLVYNLLPKGDSTNEVDEIPAATVSVYEGAVPHVIVTSDALSRYVENKKSDGLVQESDIYLPEDVDWNEEVLVAVQFDALQAKSFRSITRETVNGEESYVVELLGVAEGCSTIQINTVRIAFIAQQTSQDTSLPVILRTVPNTASCEL